MLNVQDQSQTAGNFSRFIGLANLKVIAINPTKAQIKQLFNRELEKEPNSWDEKSNQRKVTFYLQGEGTAILQDGSRATKEINATHTVFLKNEIQVSKNGQSKVYTDNFGNSIYLTQQDYNSRPEKYKLHWESLREAYHGEADLLDIMKALLAPAREQEFFIPDVNKIIATGNVSQLQNAVASANKYGNTIRVLLGIRTGEGGKQYQTIYKKKIDRGTNTNLQYLWKSMRDNKDFTKDYFGDFNYSSEHPDPKAFTLREYYPGMEGSLGSTAAPAAAAQNFNNMFASLGNQTPAAGYTVEHPSMIANQIPQNPVTSNDNIFSDEDDDLPF